MLDALAIVLEKPEHIALSRLAITSPEPDDVVVQTLWSGVSSGTERLLFTGRMPHFPGMGYPLVPGYETVGEVLAVGKPLARPGTLAEIKADKRFADMPLVRLARLSVQPVTEAEWALLCKMGGL